MLWAPLRLASRASPPPALPAAPEGSRCPLPKGEAPPGAAAVGLSLPGPAAFGPQRFPFSAPFEEMAEWRPRGACEPGGVPQTAPCLLVAQRLPDTAEGRARLGALPPAPGVLGAAFHKSLCRKVVDPNVFCFFLERLLRACSTFTYSVVQHLGVTEPFVKFHENVERFSPKTYKAECAPFVYICKGVQSPTPHSHSPIHGPSVIFPLPLR